MELPVKAGLDENPRLERCVSERLPGLFGCGLPVHGSTQRIVGHFPHRPSTVRPFVVRKAFQRLPNGMDQACFPGFAEADAHRPIEGDLSHHCAERPSLTGVPKRIPAVYLLRFLFVGGTRSTSPIRITPRTGLFDFLAPKFP
jgi:hypothetical protein